MTADKFRFRFAKSGTLRLVSHHDLMRCFERMLRRAAVPFKSTAGFHPTPRLVFALSLPLGVVGLDEVVELELTEPRDGDQLLQTLAAQSPPGLTFKSVAAVPMKATARVRRVVYAVPLPDDRAAEAEAACGRLLAEPKVWVERLRPSAKRLNIRPYIRGIRVAPTPQPPPCREGASEPSCAIGVNELSRFEAPSLQGGGWGVGSSLRMDLWVTQEGTARADELLRLLSLSDLIDGGAVLERAAVELRDEVSPDQPDGPPDGPSDSVPLTGPEVAALSARLDAETRTEITAAADWGASPNGPVVE
jgi:radical SAM-linked protein